LSLHSSFSFSRELASFARSLLWPRFQAEESPQKGKIDGVDQSNIHDQPKNKAANKKLCDFVFCRVVVALGVVKEKEGDER